MCLSAYLIQLVEESGLSLQPSLKYSTCPTQPNSGLCPKRHFEGRSGTEVKETARTMTRGSTSERGRGICPTQEKCVYHREPSSMDERRYILESFLCSSRLLLSLCGVSSICRSSSESISRASASDGLGGARICAPLWLRVRSEALIFLPGGRGMGGRETPKLTRLT